MLAVRNGLSFCAWCLGATFLGAALALGPAAHAQGANAYSPPRLANGHPDFQGRWTNTSLTVLERPADLTSLTLTEEQAMRAARVRNAASDRDNERTDPDAPAPKSGNVGGYNSFWIDTGTRFGRIGDEYRSSWLVDPPNGKLPYSEAGRKLFTESFNRQRNATDGPEVRSLGERCLLGFGSSGGPPMLNVSYNNHYQIVQTPDEVVVVSEMIHDKHRPASMHRWMGDPIGWWDGDTLVIETTNLHPQESMRVYYGQSLYISKDARITERFTRISDTELLYAFTVDDPSVFSQPWRAEMIFYSTDEDSYEYACHEANYSMPGILAGGRLEDRTAKR
jgi:hypothetical protein